MDEQTQVMERNKILLRLLFEEALHQGNLAIVDQIFSPAFIDHSTPDQPTGPAGVKDYFREIRSGFPDIQITIEDLIAEGDKVVVRTTWQGTHLGVYDNAPHTGRSVTRTLIQIFCVRDGLIVEEWNEGAGLLL